MSEIKLIEKEGAANMLGYAARTIADARWRARVGLHAIRIGGRLQFLEKDLVTLIERGKERETNKVER